MSKRKIAECINIRINVAQYEHIELVKYAEEEIEYSSDAERIQKEDALRDDLVVSMIRSMKAIPERLGKGIEKAIEVQESIKKVLPAWLENNPVPNIANSAAKRFDQAVAKQNVQKIEQDKIIPADLKQETAAAETKVEETKSDTALTAEDDVKDLFEEDAPSATSAKVEVKEADKAEVKAETDEMETVETGTTDDIFDDDLFNK